MIFGTVHLHCIYLVTGCPSTSKQAQNIDIRALALSGVSMPYQNP